MKGLVIAVGILSVIIIILVAYILLIQLQLKGINRQLMKRLTENTRQPVSLELINKRLNELTANINKCLKAEDTLRLKGFRADKKFKELIANISHDLRTPLTAIKGYQQLMEKGELTEEQRKKLEIVQKHTEGLGQLIEHFFEYSYLLNVESEITLEQINLTNLVAECLVASIPIFEEKNLKIHFEETPPIFVLADKEMVIRIVDNLNRNCAQYSIGEIEVGLQVCKYAVISFKNPVKNASEIDVNQLFDRFYTSDKARNRSTGLGLAIVKLLAEKMSGKAEAVLHNELLEIRVSLPRRL